MQLQGPLCQHLSLFDSDHGRNVNSSKRIRLDLLVRERDGGCTGCRMVCEVIPLLNDYCKNHLDACKIFVYATRRPAGDGDSDMLWSLTVEDEDGQLGEFELCKTNAGAVPWSCIRDPPKRELRHLGPRSEYAWSLITKWNAECREEHDDCRLSRATEGPSRLLHVGNGPLEGSNTIRLVVCDISAPLEYVALSHCWGSGKNKPLQTTRENYAEHLAEINIASLSRTFRDAVEVCKRLKEQYIWIDSLCIIQDDEGDKVNEIPRMQAVYEGAALTITAMSARDGRGGCWIPARHDFSLPTGEGASIELAFHRSIRSMWGHAPFLGTGLDVDLSPEYPLATRKWTLQERVLSRRMLHFKANDLVWECRSKAYCACTAVDMHDPGYNTQRNVFKILSGEENDHVDIISGWMSLVVSYSRAKSSYHADILPALAGLAAGFSDKNLGRYCAGLWEASLPLTLCWSIDHGEPAKEVTSSRIPGYVAPTWSWASVEGPLCLDMMGQLDTELESLPFVAKIISVACEAEGKFGQVRSGTVTIDTSVCVVPPHSITATTISGFEDAKFRVDTSSDVPREQNCVLALMIESSFYDDSQALVLVENGDGTYSRCGLLVCLPDILLKRFQKLTGYTELEIV